MSDDTGNMVSRAVQKVPEDPKEQRKFLRKILRDHYRDISTLFSQTTDNDRIEQLRRENDS